MTERSRHYIADYTELREALLERIGEQSGPIAAAPHDFVRLGVERVRHTVLASVGRWPDFVLAHFTTTCDAAVDHLDRRSDAVGDGPTRLAAGLVVCDRFEAEHSASDLGGHLEDLMDVVELVSGAADPGSATTCQRIAEQLCTAAESSDDAGGTEDFLTLGTAEVRVQQRILDRMLGGVGWAALDGEFGRITVGR